MSRFLSNLSSPTKSGFGSNGLDDQQQQAEDEAELADLEEILKLKKRISESNERLCWIQANHECRMERLQKEQQEAEQARAELEATRKAESDRIAAEERQSQEEKERLKREQETALHRELETSEDKLVRLEKRLAHLATNAYWAVQQQAILNRPAEEAAIWDAAKRCEQESLKRQEERAAKDAAERAVRQEERRMRTKQRLELNEIESQARNEIEQEWQTVFDGFVSKRDKLVAACDAIAKELELLERNLQAQQQKVQALAMHGKALLESRVLGNQWDLEHRQLFYQAEPSR